MDELQRIETYRQRWRRTRKPLHMRDTDCRDFGSGRLHPAAEEMRARLLILPADPEEHLIEFDDDFWTWWATDSMDPHTKQSSAFGLESSSLSGAAYRYRGAADKWERYVALTHAGALEMCLGWDAVYQLRRQEGGDVDVFRLITIVGRTAAALAHYGEVIQRFHLDGPWEVTLTLRGTRGSLLGDFATGWADVQRPFYSGRKNVELNVLMRRELSAWSDEDGVRELAYRLGDQIENSWGYVYHRYLARDGEYEGKFDVGQYVRR